MDTYALLVPHNHTVFLASWACNERPRERSWTPAIKKFQGLDKVASERWHGHYQCYISLLCRPNLSLQFGSQLHLNSNEARNNSLGRLRCARAQSSSGWHFSSQIQPIVSHRGRTVKASSAGSGQLETSGADSSGERSLGILLEVDGVLADTHRYGHREAFNSAFCTLSLDCANWSPAVYDDLLRKAGANEHAMVATFFKQIGWPMAVATSETDSFVHSVIAAKKVALERAVEAGKIPLRPGLVNFVDAVTEAGIPIAILASGSKAGEGAARALYQKLGSKRTAGMHFIGDAEVAASDYGQVALGTGAAAGMDETLASEVTKAVAAEKQRVAAEVAAALKVSIQLDTGSPQGLRRGVAVLRAAAEACNVEASNCVLLAGSNVGVQAAARAGIPCIVIRSSLTARGDFLQARAALDGFGAPALTLARLRRLLATTADPRP